MSPRAAALLIACIASLAAIRPAAAQRDVSRDGRITSRLDASTAGAVQTVVDAAVAAGLPAEPLILKALEGASKGARGPQIVAAVGRLRGQLGDSRAALGGSATEDEMVAGSAALQAGITPETIRGLRAARPTGSLATALSVLTDLVSRGVPADTAARVVMDLVRSGATDVQLVAYQRGVERGLSSGLPAAAAAQGAGRPGAAGPPASVPATPSKPTRPGAGRPPTP